MKKILLALSILGVVFSSSPRTSVIDVMDTVCFAGELIGKEGCAIILTVGFLSVARLKKAIKNVNAA